MPNEYTPRAYGWEHLVYLVIFFAAFIGSLVAIKLKIKKEKTIDILVKCLGGVLLALIIWNRICIAFHKHSAWFLIPDSFCGVSSFCLSICALVCKRNALPFHWLCYIAFFGGMVVTFYPDFLGQASSFMYPATISGLLHHGLAAYISLLMALTGYFKPSVKKFYIFPVGLSFMMCWGLFLVDALGFETAMFIGAPLIKGSFLTWYVIGPALVLAEFGGLHLYEYVLKKTKKDMQVSENTDDGRFTENTYNTDNTDNTEAAD